MTREEAKDYIREWCPYDRQEEIIKALEQEPTPKNDLGVDKFDKAINQSDLEEWIMETFPDWCNGDVRLIMNHMDEMPSVTPQETRKGEWLRMSDLSEKEDDRYQCSYCGNVVHYKSKIDLYTFNSWCGRCGCDNGRHINCEVEE